MTENENVMIREDPDKGVYLSGVHTQPFSTFNEGMFCFKKGDENRTTALTKMVSF